MHHTKTKTNKHRQEKWQFIVGDNSKLIYTIKELYTNTGSPNSEVRDVASQQHHEIHST